MTIHSAAPARSAPMTTCNVRDLAPRAVPKLTAVPGTPVRCPRIGEAPVALECHRRLGISVGRSREIVLGRVLAIHGRSDLVDAATRYVDQAGLDAIGRMGGHGYARTRDYFDLPTMALAQWQAGERPARTPVARSVLASEPSQEGRTRS